MDSRLENAKEGIELLSLEVRDGAFLEGLPPGTAKTWRRNDIIFATELSAPETNTSRRQPAAFTITTPYAREAGVLFDRLLSLFLPLLDECIEHDFSDRLGEAALEYSGYADRSDQTTVNLLKILLTEAEDILEEMRAGEFPYTAGGAVSWDGGNSWKEGKAMSKVTFFLNEPRGKPWKHFLEMMPRMGDKYKVEIVTVSKPKAEFHTDEYYALDLPVAPAVMVDEEIVVEGSDVDDHTVEVAICGALGLPSPEPPKKSMGDKLFGR